MASAAGGLVSVARETRSICRMAFAAGVCRLLSHETHRVAGWRPLFRPHICSHVPAGACRAWHVPSYILITLSPLSAALVAPSRELAAVHTSDGSCVTQKRSSHEASPPMGGAATGFAQPSSDESILSSAPHARAVALRHRFLDGSAFRRQSSACHWLPCRGLRPRPVPRLQQTAV